MRLRQVALVAEKLAPVREQLFTLLGVEKDFADEGVGEFGLHNSVMALGDTFLEVVAPTQPGTTAGRLLERRGGDGGYMVLVQVDDIVPVRERIDAMGIRRVWNIDRDEVSAFHVHPRDIGAAIVSFDEMRPAPEWLWGGPNWRDQVAGSVGNIIGCDLQAIDPQALATRWSEAYDRPVTRDGDRFVMLLDDGSWIAFIEAADGRGDGVAGFTVSATAPEQIRAAADSLGLRVDAGTVQVGGATVRFEGLD